MIHSYDRTETNSECSSYSLDNGLDLDSDMIPSIDEEVDGFEESNDMEPIYENVQIVPDKVETTCNDTMDRSYSPPPPIPERYSSLPGHRTSWSQSLKYPKVSAV